ncbi:MAG: hypothetical protein ACRED5_13470, partial [Propylenella sp.]
MDQALASKRHEIGLGCAPIVQLHCPFAGAPEIEYALTSQDHGAIDHAGEDGRYVPNRHSDHRIAEKGNTLGLPVEPDDRLAFPQKRNGQKISVRKAVGYGDGFVERGGGRLAVASEHRNKTVKAPYISLFDTFLSVFGEDALCAGKPASPLRGFAGQEICEAQPEPPAGSLIRGRLAQAKTVKPRPGRNCLVVAANKIRSG